MASRWWNWGRVEVFLWAALALALPLTSFPLVKKLTGADMVAPASGPILLLLLPVSILPLLVRGGKIPRAVIPLLAFASAVLISCSLALFLPVPPFRDLSILSSMLKALFTLAIGMAFYLGVAIWAKDPSRVAFLLRWLNWGGLAIIVWVIVQAIIWQQQLAYPPWMDSIQAVFSVSGLYSARASGFAYEPSWLAHQLNMLYLPFWLAASLLGTTVHRQRIGFLTFERLLLVGGLVALWFSVSRVGFLAFLFCMILVLGMGAGRLIGWLQAKILAGRPQRLAKFLLSFILLFGTGVVVVAIFLGVGFVMTKVDPRMRNLFNPATLSDFSLVRYANQLVFAERVVFWETGWNIFNDYPIFGVGLGNAGYFFSDHLSTYGWALTEVRTIMYHLGAIPNIKSLWVRLLAETGIVGTGLFLSWLYGIWASAKRLLGKPGLAGTVGLAGLFVLVGLIAEGFSLDTFALPYFWVSFGLVTALAVRGTMLDSSEKGEISIEHNQ